MRAPRRRAGGGRSGASAAPGGRAGSACGRHCRRGGQRVPRRRAGQPVAWGPRSAAGRRPAAGRAPAGGAAPSACAGRAGRGTGGSHRSGSGCASGHGLVSIYGARQTRLTCTSRTDRALCAGRAAGPPRARVSPAVCAAGHASTGARPSALCCVVCRVLGARPPRPQQPPCTTLATRGASPGCWTPRQQRRNRGCPRPRTAPPTPAAPAA